MSQSLERAHISQKNDRDEFYQGHNSVISSNSGKSGSQYKHKTNDDNNNNKHNDGLFAMPIDNARTVDQVRNSVTNSAMDTSLNSNNNNNTQMSLVLASPMSNASMKDLKKSYHQKKKYFTKNIQSAIDSAQEVHSGWLKARTTFKRWTKTWCQVKPGYLILYTSQEAQKKHRLGVVLLSVCQVIKRPTKKDGFCFKLINPFGCSVWAKSSTRAIVFAQASLTLRVSDESIGKLWLDALHRCHLSSNLEGYQPIIDDDGIARGSGANSRLDDTGDSSGDEAEHSVRQFEFMLDHSNSTSDNNSLSSMQRQQNNFIRQTINGRQMINGSTPLKSIANSEHSNEAAKFSDILAKHQNHDNLSSKMRNINVIKQQQQQQYPSCSQSTSQQQQNIRPHYEFNNNNSNSNNEDNLIRQAANNLIASNATALSLKCSQMVAKFSKYTWQELQLENVAYLEDGAEELGSAGMQSEEVHDSNKNFLWHIIKQLRPGMDLSKVTLPTFILEPRSFLEKLADYYYHCDILSEAVTTDDPVSRLINIVKWYLSGFYKKPKGPKKPYNPILGERFRCFWEHPKTKSRTFFVAEQVSHHPPISAFHVANRKDGYTITCALLSRSKYGGNSVSAILDGKAKIFLNKRKETYTVTMPYANCRGILLGSLCMELGGKVEIECVETNCKCELDFKLASMWANQSSYNTLTGKILKDNKVTHTLEGHWDKKINITDKSSDKKSTLWEVTNVVRSSRLKRYTVNLRDQDERESVKLWAKVTEALIAGNQVLATAEKTRLEDLQRKEARERQGPFEPQHFQHLSTVVADWTYKWLDDRVWDDRRDIMQFEENFKIRTLMLGPAETSSSKTSQLNTAVDLPLTQLNRFASQMRGVTAGSTNAQVSGQRNEKQSASGSGGSFPVGEVNGDTMRTLESRITAGNLIFEEALKQVNEKNRKLEEDIALLKRTRGKRTLALFMTAIIIALISVFYKFLS